MRCRREVMEISFARWNRLQTATPWFRKGEGTETAARTTCQDKTTVALPIPRSGLVLEILCGPPHKISQSHSNPSGSFDTDRHSIGSTNDASVLGNESNRARISFCMLFHTKTDAT